MAPAILWGRKLLYVVCQTTKAATSVKVGLLHEHAAYCAVVPRPAGSTWGRGDMDDRVPSYALSGSGEHALSMPCASPTPFSFCRSGRSALRRAASAAMLYSS